MDGSNLNMPSMKLSGVLGTSGVDIREVQSTGDTSYVQRGMGSNAPASDATRSGGNPGIPSARCNSLPKLQPRNLEL
jgi:hypothetical protein